MHAARLEPRGGRGGAHRVSRGLAEEWVEALERLVGDPDLRAAMGERSAEVAHERYTLQANADRIVSAFRSALS